MGKPHQWTVSCWHAFFTAARVHGVYKGVSGEETKRCLWFPFGVKHKKKRKKVEIKSEKRGMGDGVECLEERCCKSFFLLGAVFCPLVRVELFHAVVTPRFKLTYPSRSMQESSWGWGVARRWRGRLKQPKLRWVVIRNITVIVGLSDPTFLPVWIFIRRVLQRQNYPGNQLLSFLTSPDKRANNQVAEWSALNHHEWLSMRIQTFINSS